MHERSEPSLQEPAAMSVETGLITVTTVNSAQPSDSPHATRLPHRGDVEKRLDKLPPRTRKSARDLRTHAREGSGTFSRSSPGGLPAMEHLYDEMPNFNDVLDDVKRQLALCQDSRDALEITPMLLLGPAPASARRTSRAKWRSCWAPGWASSA
jgi:ATP-dependent Lon protease